MLVVLGDVGDFVGTFKFGDRLGEGIFADSKRVLFKFNGGGICDLAFSVGDGSGSSLMSRRSRSYVVPDMPSRSHCSCIIRLACVGSIC